MTCLQTRAVAARDHQSLDTGCGIQGSSRCLRPLAVALNKNTFLGCKPQFGDVDVGVGVADGLTWMSVVSKRLTAAAGCSSHFPDTGSSFGYRLPCVA
jgi:hypothetical protein